MNAKKSAQVVGLTIIISTHVYMLNNMLPESVMKEHAMLNLVSAGLIIWSLY